MGKILDNLSERMENYIEDHKGDHGIVKPIFIVGLLLIVGSIVAGWMGFATPIDLWNYGVLIVATCLLYFAIVVIAATIVAIIIFIIDHFFGQEDEVQVDGPQKVVIDGETIYEGDGEITLCVDGVAIAKLGKGGLVKE